MQFSTKFTSLALAAAACTSLFAAAGANPTFMTARSSDDDTSYVVSFQQMQDWLATTSASLTFIGAPINPLVPRTAESTIVTYCSTVNGNECDGPCTVFNGGGTCLYAPNTNCLSATNNVVFCSSGACGGGCNELDTCGVRLDGGFCYTPGTNSILVS